MSSRRTVPIREDSWRASEDDLAPTPVTDLPQPWLGRLLLVSLLVMLNLPMTVGCQRNWTLLRPRKPKRLGVVEAPSEG